MNIIFKIFNYLNKHRQKILHNVLLILTLSGITVFIVTCIAINNYRTECEEFKVKIEELKGKLDTLNEEKKQLLSTIEQNEETISKTKDKVEELTNVITVLEDDNKSLQERCDELELERTQNNVYTYTPDDGYAQSLYVYKKLRNVGLNKYVCAGIMGNIMAEVGGQTLDISGWVDGSNDHYYGICQWGGPRRDRLLNDFGGSIYAQAEFLIVELFDIIPEGSSFYNLTDEKEAALYFARYYERCAEQYYAIRAVNATKALEYFANV